MTASQQAFLDKIVPFAVAEMKQYPNILASLTIAQAIIESNWGTSILATDGFNFFGIKGRYNDQCVVKETQEWVVDHYITIRAEFRKYPDIATGIHDHSVFLSKDRYKALWGNKDYKSCAYEIRLAGYATSPTYTTTLINTIEKYELYNFDKEDVMTKVYLSPSSQERNVYITGNAVEERVCNWITDALVPILQKYHIEVKRNNPLNGPMGHTNESNSWGADWHIPIHTNAGGARGCEVFCYNHTNPTAKSTIMAKNIYEELEKLTPTADRGVKTNQTFYEIIHTKAPCAYIEIDYHDSVDGATFLLSNIQNIAEAIARGILETLGIPQEVAVSYLVKTQIPIHALPDSASNKTGFITGTSMYTIIEEKSGFGKLKSGAGWVDLDYTIKQ